MNIVLYLVKRGENSIKGYEIFGSSGTERFRGMELLGIKKSLVGSLGGTALRVSE